MVVYQILLEKYGVPCWTYGDLPDLVKKWLSEEGFNQRQILTLARSSRWQAPYGPKSSGLVAELLDQLDGSSSSKMLWLEACSPSVAAKPLNSR